jgi:tRNA (guanine9-N1)-methyltransferase
MASEQSDRTADIANSIEDIQPSLEASSSNALAPLSKNAQKKAAKTARFAAQKLERRAKEKEAKKAKKRIKAQKRAAGELEEDEVHEEEEKMRMMKRAKTGAGQKPFGARVCVDLGFDEMMTDKVGGFRSVLG